MALEVYWYDFICFGIVGVAVLGSLGIILWKERYFQIDDAGLYEWLLAGRAERNGGSSPAGDGAGAGAGEELGSGTLPKSHVGTSQLWCSCWKGVHPGWLLLTRLASFFIMAGLLFWDYEDYSYSVFIYYTEWTFGLVIIYFAVGSIVSAYGCWLYYFPSPYLEAVANGFSRRDMEDGVNGPTITYSEQEIIGSTLMQLYTQKQILERAGFWGYLMQIVFQAAAGAVIYTDFIFWCLIVPFLATLRLGLNPLMGCMHTLNAFFLLLDTSLNSLSFPWYRISYFLLWTAVYVIFQWVIHACGLSWWPYPFLVLSTPWAPLWYFCLAVMTLPCYCIYTLIVKAKYTLFPKWFPQSFVKISQQ